MRNKKLVIMLGALLTVVGSASFYYFLPRQRSGIYSYRITQDLPFIRELFKQNWYWLVAEGSTFDLEHTFTHLSPTRNPADNGKVIAHMYWLSGKPAGFIAYHLHNFYEGRIWFLVVQEEFRGRGIAEQLFAYALNDLQQQGARRVFLITRTDNVKAQNLYRKMGLNEFWRDDRFIKFEKQLV